MSDLICGRIAAGENYNLTRDKKEYMVLVEGLEDVVSIIFDDHSDIKREERLWKSDSYENLKKELMIF